MLKQLVFDTTKGIDKTAVKPNHAATKQQSQGSIMLSAQKPTSLSQNEIDPQSMKKAMLSVV